MINKLKDLYYYIRNSKTIRIRFISSIIFMLLFFLICVIFEIFAHGLVANQINNLIHNILFFGL
jgi:hypothetical protein